MDWSNNGIEGRGEFPPVLLNRFKGRALVLGTGRTIWEDLSRANQKGCEVVAVNNMILHYKGKVTHGCSLHPEEPELWKALRPAYHAEPCEVITHSQLANGHKAKTDFTWYIDRGGGGTSGLFATMLALALGYEQVTLCGIPMDAEGHFYDPPTQRDGCFKSDFVRNEWRECNQLYFRGRVKSMSGFTRDLLGCP